MKKIMLFLMCMSIVLIGCTNSNTMKETEKNVTAEEQNAGKEETIGEHKTDVKETETSTSNKEKRMVVLNGKMYVDTGEKGDISCGTMDFSFDKTTDKEPTENGETNFGKGYKGQYYRRNQIIVMIEGKPCVFACWQNDIEGVTMFVKEFSKKKAEICIENLTELEWNYGEKFELEYFDLESRTWKTVNKVRKHAGFKDIAYVVNAGETTDITVEWEWLYGTLEKGKYRIVKELNPAPYLSIVRDHTYTAEFEILK